MRSIFFILVVVSLVSCKGPKYYTKLGTKQEASGLTTEAANSYYTALMRKRSYIDAQIGMKRTGQTVLNQKMAEFGRKKTMGTAKEGVYAYLEADDYRKKISNAGVNLEVSQMYLDDFDAAKAQYVSELYEKGTMHLEREEYRDAEVTFKELTKFDPNFKDAKDLGDVAYLEPLYKDGKAMLEAGRYRSAYESLNKVLAKKSNYKNSLDLKNQSLEKGTITVALLPFSNGTRTQNAEVNMSAYTLSALTNIKDPFLRVVDREHMMAILQEQKLQLSGVVDDATAVEVGKIVGAQVILTGTVLKYDEKRGTVNRDTRTAYQSYSEKQVSNGQEVVVTKYKPVDYSSYYGKSYCSMDAQVKLISLKTGELLRTNMITKKLEDEVYYAKSDYDRNSLFPGEGGRVETASDKVQAFRGLFNARKELKSVDELNGDLYRAVTNEMAEQVKSLMLELVR
jgi:tetratricopeptide (TPR) repeat protein